MFQNTPVLDVHAHVTVPLAANTMLVGLMASNTAFPSPFSPEPAAHRFVPDVPEEEFRAAAEGHVRYIDERSIDFQVLGPRPFMQMGWIESHLILPWTQYINDLIHQQCEWHPTRFLGAAALPQLWDAPDTQHCLPELDRCIREYGFVAAYVSPDPSGRRTTPGLDDPYWYPLYESCQASDIPIIIHGTTGLDKRVRHVPHNYQLNFVVEQYLATQILGHSDVFDRFPDLRVVVCHLGGALNRFIATDVHLPQRDLSRHLFFDSCGYDLSFLEAGIRQRGVDQICFGVEAPGSGRAIRPETGRSSDDLVPVIGEEFGWLTDADRHKIFYDNPLRVVPGLARLLPTASAPAGVLPELGASGQ